MKILSGALTERAVRTLLAEQVQRSGGISKLAEKWKVSPSLISLSSSGKRKPSPTILVKLGLTREARITYTYRYK